MCAEGYVHAVNLFILNVTYSPFSISTYYCTPLVLPDLHLLRVLTKVNVSQVSSNQSRELILFTEFCSILFK